MRMFSALVAVAVAVIGAGCSDTNAAAASASADAKPVLAALTANVFLPSLKDLDVQASGLQNAVDGWETSEPNAQALSTAQDVWKSARVAWKLTDAFRFGPVESLRITPALDFSPTNAVSLEKFVEGAEPITRASVEQLGANLRGFGALEYLLFDTTGDAAVLAKLVGATGARRRMYVQVTSLLVREKVAELKSAWGDGKAAGFARDIAEAGGGSATFPSAKSAIDQIVNSAIFSAELVTNTKIGRPAGKKTGGTPQPSEVDSARSDNTIAELTAALRGVVQVYVGDRASALGGTNAPGVSALVRAKNPELDKRVLAALGVAIERVAAIRPPFRNAIVDHAPEVEGAYQAVKAAKNIMSTEVTSTLGTTLKFNDNDGD